MLDLPFSRTDFFEVFAQYNTAVWPAQLVLYALALVAVALAFRRSRGASRGASLILTVLWTWMALVYHATFFAAINPAAFLFAAVFLVQAILFLEFAVGGNTLIAPRNNLSGWAGAGLVVLGLVVYPVVSLASGHSYPSQPTFGLPCPTTIFTLGVLLWTRETFRRRMFIIPLLWSLTGTVAALQLGVTEDLSLGFALVLVLFTLQRRKSSAQSRNNLATELQ